MNEHQTHTLHVLARDLDNIREVFRWSATTEGEVVIGLHLVAVLRRYWVAAGYLSEGRAWLRLLLASQHQRELPVPSAIICRALFVAGFLADLQLDFAEAGALLEESRALAEQIGDQECLAQAMTRLGIIAIDEGEEQHGRELLQQSLTISMAIGNRSEEATALQLLGYAASRKGRSEEAELLYEQSLLLHEQIGDQLAIANTLNLLGEIAVDRGKFDHAQHHYARSLMLFRSLEAPAQIGMALHNLGVIARRAEQFEQALSMFREALQWRTAAGDERGIAVEQVGIAAALCGLGQLEQSQNIAEEGYALFKRLHNQRGMATAAGVLAEIALRQDRLDASEMYYRQHAAYFLKHGSIADWLNDLYGLAHLAAHRGFAEMAIRRYAAAETTRVQAQVVLSITSQQCIESDLPNLRALVSNVLFETLWQSSTDLSQEEIQADLLA
jgi:tetratricopeptide (TPR) repeat protein